MPFFSDIESMNEYCRRFDALTPFWIVLHHDDPFGPDNLGVSSHSVHDAANVLDAALMLPESGLRSFVDSALAKNLQFHMPKCLVQFDLNLLDRARVLPFIGRTDIEGIWWPRLTRGF